MGRKVAVVTGANRGLGMELVRQLCANFEGDVILTSRMSDRGQKAMEQLKREGLYPRFHELDITQPGSIRMFEEFIIENYRGIDILINNAAVTYPKAENVPHSRQAQLSIDTDFRGTVNVCRILLPHMRPHGRIVIITNGYIGQKKELKSNLQRELDIEKMSLFQLTSLIDQYMKSVKYGNYQNYGWPSSPSIVAKIFLTALAKVLSKSLDDDIRENILINACCPGWMNSTGSEIYRDEGGLCNGVKLQSLEEAAKDVLWLATLPDGTKSPKGVLVRHRQIIDFK